MEEGRGTSPVPWRAHGDVRVGKRLQPSGNQDLGSCTNTSPAMSSRAEEEEGGLHRDSSGL